MPYRRNTQSIERLFINGKVGIVGVAATAAVKSGHLFITHRVNPEAFFLILSHIAAIGMRADFRRDPERAETPGSYFLASGRALRDAPAGRFPCLQIQLRLVDQLKP